MARRPDDVPILKATVKSLVELRLGLPLGYDTVRSALVRAELTAGRALGELLADMELER